MFSQSLPSRKTCIGIDLGTTNSCVCIMDNNQPRILENAEGKRTTPSYVSFTPSGIVVGEAAKRLQSLHPTTTVSAVKRLIGMQHSTLPKNLNTSYKVIPAKNGDAWIEVNGKSYSPSQISSYVLSKLKKDAEAKLNTKVNEAVITVPAYFNDAQRQATKDAGALAGLNVKRIINEPTAAALAYGIDSTKKNEGKNVAVYDLGGGTFDISILEISNGIFQVKATNGDTILGGEDFDNAIMKFIIDSFERKHKRKLKLTKQTMTRIKEASEKCKCELSSSEESIISLPFIDGQDSLELTISRRIIENVCRSISKKTEQPCLQCLKDARLRAKDINEIVLVGGMTRMPLIQQTVREIFGKVPSQKVNPDEAVAIGAAMQAAVLEGKKKDIVLVDVTPLTLGIETYGGIMTPLINRNSTIPTTISKEFTTTADYQKEVDIKVYQGERRLCRNNKQLGEFKLVGITPAKKGVAKIVVTFDIDANGIVKVSAMDKATGKKTSIQVKSNGGLSESEIQRIIKEGKDNEQSDVNEEEMIKTKLELKQLIENSMTILDQMKKKQTIKSTVYEKLEKELNVAKDNMKVIEEKERWSGKKDHQIVVNIEGIKENMKKLEEEMMFCSTELYK